MTDFIQDLEAELVSAAKRRAATGDGGLAPARRALRGAARRRSVAAIALVALAALVVAALLTLRPAEQPATPTPGAFVPPPATPIRACDATPQSQIPMTIDAIDGARPDAVKRALAVLRRPNDPRDGLLAKTPIDTWLPVGELDPGAIRRTSIPATYLVPTSDLRTKPVACGASESRGAGACLAMPAHYACFTLAEIREGRALARNGRVLVGIVPDGVRWLRLGDGYGALVAGNAIQHVWGLGPVTLTFERETPPVAVLNGTPTPTLATRLADRLTSLLRRRPAVGNAAVEYRSDGVYAAGSQDVALADAIASWIGAPSTAVTADVERLGAPYGTKIVVVLGDRMR